MQCCLLEKILSYVKSCIVRVERALFKIKKPSVSTELCFNDRLLCSWPCALHLCHMERVWYMLHKRVYSQHVLLFEIAAAWCLNNTCLFLLFQDNMQSFVVHAVSFSATIAAEITHFTRCLVTNGFTILFKSSFFLTLIKKETLNDK